MDTGLRLRIALHADGLPRAFACARVGGGALAAHGQAAHMADAAITLDALQALEVHAQFAAKIAFDHVPAVLNSMDDLRNLLLGEVLGADVRIDLGSLEHSDGVDGADAVDVTQRDIDALLGRNLNSNNAWHILLTLTLFVARVGANDANHALATNDFAILAELSY